MYRLPLIALMPVLAATSASSYGTEPVVTIVDVSVVVGERVEPGEICVPPLSPELVAALSVDDFVAEPDSLALVCIRDD